jgi:FkbM family methyltransferase
MHRLRSILLSAIQDSPFEELARRLYGVLARGRGARYDRETSLVMQRVLAPNSNCVDIGAYRGEILRQMLQLAPEGRVFAFEPVPGNCRYLAAKYQEADIYNIALADRAGSAEFFHALGRPARSGLKKQKYPDPDEKVETLTVQVETLDNVIPPDVRIDLIKIDVEGAELNVLKGGERVIRQSRPVIIFEHGSEAIRRYGWSSEALYDFVVNKTGCKLSSMEKWLTGGEPYCRTGFIEAGKNGEFGFIAY